MSRYLETLYAVALFLGYLGLWKTKNAHQRRTTGVDPEVFRTSTTPLQRFMSRGETALTVSVVLLLGLHTAPLGHLWPFHRAVSLDGMLWDHLGISIAFAGLALCAVAQWTLGVSWRVGIDEKVKTPLVTAGLYRWIRNPTYLGLFLVMGGFWLIWPTPSVALFVLAFYFMLEVQVRCEEEHLLRLHGATYQAYLESTSRYVPWVW